MRTLEDMQRELTLASENESLRRELATARDTIIRLGNKLNQESANCTRFRDMSVELRQKYEAVFAERGEAQIELTALKAERDNLRDCMEHQIELLCAARDVLADFAHQVSFVEHQNAYSTRMTNAEKQINQAVLDLTTAIDAARQVKR